MSNDEIESVQTLKTVAESVFLDYKSNGFSGDLAIAYNVLISAANYLRTGEVMAGGRCEKFFQERA